MNKEELIEQYKTFCKKWDGENWNKGIGDILKGFDTPEGCAKVMKSRLLVFRDKIEDIDLFMQDPYEIANEAIDMGKMLIEIDEYAKDTQMITDIMEDLEEQGELDV